MRERWVLDDLEKDEVLWLLANYLYERYSTKELYKLYRTKGRRDGPSLSHKMDKLVKHTATQYREALVYALIQKAFSAEDQAFNLLRSRIDYMRKDAFSKTSPKKG